MKNSIFKIFNRKSPVCPWWLCFTFDNPFRKILQNPFKILIPFVKAGDSVLDIGPGMGYFTFPLSKIVGAAGRVVALDIQEGMIRRLEKKLIKRHISNVETKLYDGNSFPLKGKFDFILLFWMYHEVDNKDAFIDGIKAVVKRNSLLLIAEPKFHVNKSSFDNSIRLFTDKGFKVSVKPQIPFSRSVVLKKT